MPDPMGGLQTLAEIAITLAGFSGLIAVFSSQDSWGRTEKTRFLNILILCFLVVLCAMFPIFSGTYFADESSAWRISCFVFGIVQIIIVIRFLTSVLRSSWRPEMPYLSIPISVVGFMVGIAALSAAMLNVPIPTPNLLGLLLIWGLVAASFQFIFSLQSAWRQAEGDV